MMKNFALAVKYGVKKFFKRQVDHGDFIKNTKAGFGIGKENKELDGNGNVKKDAYGRATRRGYSRWSYDELCLLTVLAGIHKHTFGVPGSIIQAIKEGRWKYHDLKSIETSAPSIFAGTNVSPEGQKRILKVLRQGKGGASQMFSREDTAVMRRFYDTADVPRDCINF
jgi:hypothetical protein